MQGARLGNRTRRNGPSHFTNHQPGGMAMGGAYSQPVHHPGFGARRNSLPQKHSSSSGETRAFLDFVGLLASKSADHQAMLLNRALQEASGPAGATHAMRRGVVNNNSATTGLTRSASAGDMRRPRSSPAAGHAALRASSPAAANGHNGWTAAQLDGGAQWPSAAKRIGGGGAAAHELRLQQHMQQVRPGTAEGMLTGGGGGWGDGWDDSNLMGQSLDSALLARLAGGPPGGGAALFHQAAWRQHEEQRRRAHAAATTLQAQWRGWQHRRICRFLRARGKRWQKLTFLAHVEWMRSFLSYRAAAVHVQAAWRAYASRMRQLYPRGRDALPARAIAASIAASRAAAAARAGAHDEAELLALLAEADAAGAPPLAAARAPNAAAKPTAASAAAAARAAARRTAAQRVKAAQLPEKQQPLKTDAERARARATRKAKLKWKGDDELHEVRSYIPAAAPPSAGLHGDGLVVAIGDDEE